jgi:hypothetical protein
MVLIKYDTPSNITKHTAYCDTDAEIPGLSLNVGVAAILWRSYRKGLYRFDHIETGPNPEPCLCIRIEIIVTEIESPESL